MNDNILVCRGLVKNYKNFAALDEINLDIKRGKIIGLLGPNGSGKTTLIKIAAGMMKQTLGEVLIDGNPPGEYSKAVTSYLPDCEFLPMSMRLDALLDFYADFFADFDKVKAREMLVRFGLNMSMNMKKMSKGMREKTHLSMIMSRKAKLYLLDEPIGGVDPAARDYILHTIFTNYNPQATVMISTPLIADIEPVLNRILFIANGQVRENTTVEEIREGRGKSVDQLFREVFRCY